MYDGISWHPYTYIHTVLEDDRVMAFVCVGFAANNISENYDAKIFSVATLLSSYLIYNSVKVKVYQMFWAGTCNMCMYFLDNRSS